MKYYIDFDNTLYETATLTERMLRVISNECEVAFEKLKSEWDHTRGNIFEYAKEISNENCKDYKKIEEEINKVIENGEEFVFKDAKKFLEKQKELGNKCIMLTYLPKINQEYQMRKIIGSGISKYFSQIIMTTDLKFNLDLDYTTGIFIDDDPRDLNGLFEKNPIKIFRIRKPNNWRSELEIENKEIIECENFDEIELTF